MILNYASGRVHVSFLRWKNKSDKEIEKIEISIVD
jgi:hypothetical protein